MNKALLNLTSLSNKAPVSECLLLLLVPQQTKVLKHFCACSNGSTQLFSHRSVVWVWCGVVWCLVMGRAFLSEPPAVLPLYSNYTADLVPLGLLDCCPVNVSWSQLWLIIVAVRRLIMHALLLTQVQRNPTGKKFTPWDTPSNSPLFCIKKRKCKKKYRNKEVWKKKWREKM